MTSRNSYRKTTRTKKTRNPVLIAIFIVAIVGLFLVSSTIVIHQDKQQNFITITGETSVTLGLNGLYNELGATGIFDGKDITEEIEVVSDIDTTKPGKYTVKYNYKTLSEKREVVVGEVMNPVITLETETDSIKLGETFKASKATAIDENGQDISDKIQVEEVNLIKAETYQVAYSVEDSQGRATRIFQTIEVTPNTDYNAAGVAICMYHYVYDENNPPDDVNDRYNNYIEVKDLSEELQYLIDNKYYFPTWQEVRDYVDGKMILPDNSIVLCFDDGAKSFLDVGIPILEKYKVPATCFMITKGGGAKKVKDYPSEYVTYQTHSHEMHQGGGSIGHGGIISAMTEEEIIADLKTSMEICGNSDAFAYPYGDNTDVSRVAVEKAGLLCAVTTNPGKVFPGDDPYTLNRVRMTQGQSLDAFISQIK